MLYIALCRLKELSRALYSMNVVAVTHNVLSVTVPEGKFNDISGNLNLASNQLEVRHCMDTISSSF